MTRILFYLDDFDHGIWRSVFERAIPDVEFCSYPDWGTPDDGPAYAFVWYPPPGLLAQYPNIQAIFSLGAGVDHLTRDPDLPKGTPIIRMSDDGLKEGMREYVLMSVLMHHRDMIALITAQREKRWDRIFPKAADKVRVGMLGYGALGKTCAETLKPIGYQIAAWSRSAKPSGDDVEHFTGQEGLKPFLERSDIIVCLLPATRETDNLLNAERMNWLPTGAAIINAGRGNLIDIPALLALLDSGHLGGASLDVFPAEPTPEDSPLWDHPKVIMTPHVAAVTRPKTAARYVADNIKRIERGEPALNQLDLNSGY